MILLVFLAFLGINTLSFEHFKEIKLNDELIFQPKLQKDHIFLFFERKILKFNPNSFEIESFFEGEKYNITENGIISTQNGREFLLTFEGEKLKLEMEKFENKGLENFYGLKGVKRIFSDKDFIYAQTEDNTLHCIRKKNSKRVWKIRVPADIIAFASDPKMIYIICGSDVIMSLKRKGGDIIWWKSIKERCFPEIGLLKDNLLISYRGGIQFLNTKNGFLNQELDVSMSFAPVLLRDYLILFQIDKITIYKAKK